MDSNKIKEIIDSVSMKLIDNDPLPLQSFHNIGIAMLAIIVIGMLTIFAVEMFASIVVLPSPN